MHSLHHLWQGETRTQNFTGLPAVVVQHELDHLDGVLMTDRALTDEEIEQLENEGTSYEALEKRVTDRYMTNLQQEFVWREGELDY